MKKAFYLAAALMAGCSLLPDHSLDYRTAREVPRMTLPAGADAQAFNDVYPIPPQTVKPVWASSKFEVPQPAPLAVSGNTSVQPAAAEGGLQNVLSRTHDGNGYPTLNVSGDFSQIWDTLDQVLHATGVKVDDRNQSLGLYYLDLPDDTGKLVPYQLKVTRALSAYSISVQKDDDTLAPTTVASALFDKLQAGWPGTSATEEDSSHRKNRGLQ